MMRILFPILLIGLLSTPTLAQATASKIDEISGTWIFSVQFSAGTETYRTSLQIADNKFTGNLGIRKIEGSISDSVVTIKYLNPNGALIATGTGKLQEGVLKGEGDLGGIKFKWSARRPAVRPEGGPRTHTFTPTEFHNAFTHTIPPVLRVFPGDTVKTKSIDAFGMDENSAFRSMGGNPVTGPFFIEEAMPGDTLVVKLNSVRTNRDWARSGQSIVGNALEPGYLMNLKRAQGFNGRWKLDKEKGIAYLEQPTDQLKNLTIPLQPMLGCVGVAPPAGFVIRTSDSGVFGGNIDYNQIREGTTIYLPVFYEGALLFLGDGHAAQGDGELTGAALETSMEFEFTVNVISGKSIGTPRAENAEYLMSIGIGGSLDQALQRATTDLARWLEGDYKLNSTEAAIVMGFAVKYDVADLVDSQVSIVAKIPKTTLGQFKR
jgi:amidase